MISVILLRLLESYFRHRWLYLLPIVLLGAMAAYFTLNSRPEYQARGVLYVQAESLLSALTGVEGSSGGNWWITPAQATQGKLNELLQTDAFVRAVIRQTPLEQDMDRGPVAVQELMRMVRDSVWIQPLGDNQLAVNAYHEDPQVTYDLVNALIDAYLNWQVNAERTESEVARQFFGEVIQQYQTEIEIARAAMNDYLRAYPAPIRGERPEIEQQEVARLQADIDLAAARLTSALGNEEETRLALAQIDSNVRQSHFLIDAPSLPEEPTASLRDKVVDIGIFMAVGVTLSIAGIVGGALLDRSFRFPVDVQNRLDLPVLAMIPDTSEKRGLLRRILRRERHREQDADDEALAAPELIAVVPGADGALNGAGQKRRETVSHVEADPAQ